MKFSIHAEFLDTELLVFTFPKASRANTSELIKAKAIIMVILLVLINTWNAQEVRRTRFGSRAIIEVETEYFKDVRANCFCASLLRTQFTSWCHATSCIERARCWRNVELYSASGDLNIYARV